MLKIAKYFFIGLFFLKMLISIDSKTQSSYNQTSFKINKNLILYHAKQLFNEILSGKMTCHDSHGSHYSHSSHSSHRSHYSG